jgi:hypothetical protein
MDVQTQSVGGDSRAQHSECVGQTAPITQSDKCKVSSVLLVLRLVPRSQRLLRIILGKMVGCMRMFNISVLHQRNSFSPSYSKHSCRLFD